MSRQPTQSSTPDSPLPTVVITGSQADRPSAQVALTLSQMPSFHGQMRVELVVSRHRLRNLAEDILAELARTAEVPASED